MLLYPVFDFNILTMKTSMNKEKKEERDGTYSILYDRNKKGIKAVFIMIVESKYACLSSYSNRSTLIGILLSLARYFLECLPTLLKVEIVYLSASDSYLV